MIWAMTSQPTLWRSIRTCLFLRVRPGTRRMWKTAACQSQTRVKQEVGMESLTWSQKVDVLGDKNWKILSWLATPAFLSRLMHLKQELLVPAPARTHSQESCMHPPVFFTAGRATLNAWRAGWASGQPPASAIPQSIPWSISS